MSDAARTHIYNTTTPGGIGQAGALAAIESDFEPAAYVPELERRRDTVTEQLRDVGVTTIPSKGGWMQLMNVEELGYDSSTASELLLEESKIAATPMRHWGTPIATSSSESSSATSPSNDSKSSVIESSEPCYSTESFSVARFAFGRLSASRSRPQEP